MAEKVQFPAPGAIGEDLLVMDNQIYALANEKISPTQFKVYGYVATQPTENSSSWTEVLHFSSENMARSFEYQDGYFYFGLGYNHGDEVADAGLLIRVEIP